MFGSAQCPFRPFVRDSDDHPQEKVASTTSLRKFRSQTSDKMDKWKSKGGKSQRGEQKKTADAGARKGRKVAIHCFFTDLWLGRVEK